ncbi:hypothetical protein AG1IA_08344 [Rhizoctonia solani AG-1 IA]|uniref:Uncharacterized protein n=1 Tax=Thanatephorus cucumeris (strain AG1-IA) TaxID=983506 RepID=L8WLI1_THACA|nr:hypothetical protein AG1IA_08344 [Rhizoctonia solani AG-1 IA]
MAVIASVRRKRHVCREDDQRAIHIIYENSADNASILQNAVLLFLMITVKKGPN